MSIMTVVTPSRLYIYQITKTKSTIGSATAQEAILFEQSNPLGVLTYVCLVHTTSIHPTLPRKAATVTAAIGWSMRCREHKSVLLHHT